MMNMKTKIKKTICDDYRVFWKKDEIVKGYKDFGTKKQANNFIKQITK